MDALACMEHVESWLYLNTLEYVRLGQFSKFPATTEDSHGNLTGNPAAACGYLTSDSTLGRSYEI